MRRGFTLAAITVLHYAVLLFHISAAFFLSTIIRVAMHFLVHSTAHLPLNALNCAGEPQNGHGFKSFIFHLLQYFLRLLADKEYGFPKRPKWRAIRVSQTVDWHNIENFSPAVQNRVFDLTLPHTLLAIK